MTDDLWHRPLARIRGTELCADTGRTSPILRERGLVRAEYESSTLRGNLGLPVPENRYTRDRREAADVRVTVVPVAG